MTDFPATRVRVVSIDPCGDTEVCIMMELIVDVNRLAEVGSDLLRASIEHMKAEEAIRKKKRPKI